MLEAQEGKEAEIASFLAATLPLAEQEPQTTTWFALRSGRYRFAILDTFPDEAAPRERAQHRDRRRIGGKAAEPGAKSAVLRGVR
jgi:hypothetical protein